MRNDPLDKLAIDIDERLRLFLSRMPDDLKIRLKYWIDARVSKATSNQDKNTPEDSCQARDNYVQNR